MGAIYRFFEGLIDPFRDHDPSTPPTSLAAFYLRYVAQVWPVFLALMIIGLGVALVEVQYLRYVGQIVDMMGHTAPGALWATHWHEFLLMLVVILVLRPLFSAIHDLLVHQTIAPGFTNLIRWQNHRHVLRQSVTYFNNDFAGRVASKVMETAPSLRESSVQAADAIWFVTIYVVSAFGLFMQANVWLAMPLALWVVLYILVLRRFIPQARKRSERMSEARSQLTGRIVDSYTNIQTVKLFAHAEREDDFARAALVDHTNAFHGQSRVITGMTMSVSMLSSMLIAAMGAIAVWLWELGLISIGDVALCGGLVFRIVNMSGWIMWEITGIFERIGNVQNGVISISQPHSVIDPVTAPQMIVPQGEIHFAGVKFHYGKGKGGLEGIELKVKPGEKIGLVGPSGAGKSTLVNVLLRLYDLEGGGILIDGQDISQVTQDSLRAAVGVVTQDTSLLHRSIRDNLKYGRPGASDAEMVQAAELAHAAAFIPALTDVYGRKGYDAHVGERGVKLSGGQRQRIAIARVLLKNAPILILDEATSALDSEVEAAIQESLSDLMEGKTVIAIAHRLSTIARMDRLVVMDKGRIVETGTHSELITSGGLYARLWERQTGGFLPEAMED